MEICNIKNCNKKVHSKGYCTSHYPFYHYEYKVGTIVVKIEDKYYLMYSIKSVEKLIIDLTNKIKKGTDDRKIIKDFNKYIEKEYPNDFMNQDFRAKLFNSMIIERNDKYTFDYFRTDENGDLKKDTLSKDDLTEVRVNIKENKESKFAKSVKKLLNVRRRDMILRYKDKGIVFNEVLED